jgi:hypothetical protein
MQPTPFQIVASTASTPPADIWREFPIISIIVLVLILVAVAIFAMAKWFYNVWCRERDIDRRWKEEQNVKREEAVAEQNMLWRIAVQERDDRYQKYDEQRQKTLAEIALSMQSLGTALDTHDAQAKIIMATVNTIDRNTQPKRTAK